MGYRLGEHEGHLQTLAKAVGKPSRPNYLEPITVWWGGDRWIILDGHHRREAYERAKVVQGIPVRVFLGSLEDALAEAIVLNSRDKLPMTSRDKMNAAWKLTVCTKRSKSQVASECGVAERSVATMRSAKGLLLEQGLQLDDLLGLSWLEAQRQAKGEPPTDFDHDEATERRARRYAQSLAKALGNRPHADPEGFARALQMLDERLPLKLLETTAWADLRQDYRDALEDDEEPSDY